MKTCPHCGAEPANPQYPHIFDCDTFYDGRGRHRQSEACFSREPLFQELKKAKERIAALETALLPFAQIGDIANDPDCTVWKRAVSAGSVRLARGVLEMKDAK